MEKRAFLEVVGYTPKMKIMDVFLTGSGLDYSLSDVCRIAEISWTTLHRVFPEIEKQGMVVKTREIGRAKMYKLNKENEIANQLLTLYNGVLLKVLDEAEEKYSLKATAKVR